MFGGSGSGELEFPAGEATDCGGLNKNARTAFTQPFGRVRGEQDFPWDTLSVARFHIGVMEIRAFRSAFACAKGAVASLMYDPAISDIVRPPSVCGWFDAGRL